MARSVYGNSVSDIVIDFTTGRPVANASIPIYTSREGGSLVTDLLDMDNTPITTPVSDAGGLLRFLGPDAERGTLWADTGFGSRLALSPADIADAVDAIDVDLAGVVEESLFDAHSILVANSDNTPTALVVAASRIIGRKASGNIAALTQAEVIEILGGALSTTDRTGYWSGTAGVGTWTTRPDLDTDEVCVWYSTLDTLAPPPPTAVAGDVWKRAKGSTN